MSLDNVTVSGTYAKAGVAADTFSDADGLSFSGTGLTVTVNAGFAGINFDNIGGTLDLSGQPVSATNSNASPAAFDIDLQGTSGSENFHGTDNDNFFNGKAGADTLTGGSGNDVFFHVIGDGADIISGGGQTTADVLLVAGQGGFSATPGSANETVLVQLDGSSHITTIDTASVSGIELVALDMSGGTDTLDYTGNSQAVTVNLATGAATGFSSIAPAVPTAIAGVDNVIGGSNADTLTGSSAANVLSGGGGNDTLHGGGGNDQLYGGTSAADAGTADRATYDDAFSNYVVTSHTDVNGFVDRFDAVSESGSNKGSVDEGTDTLSGIELLQFSDTTLDLNQAVQVFHGGNLVGTFSTIQSAVNSAAAGDTVLINGAIQGTFNEAVTVSAGITLKGIGAVTINGGAASALTIDWRRRRTVGCDRQHRSGGQQLGDIELRGACGI